MVLDGLLFFVNLVKKDVWPNLDNEAVRHSGAARDPGAHRVGDQPRLGPRRLQQRVPDKRDHAPGAHLQRLLAARDVPLRGRLSHPQQAKLQHIEHA